MATIGTILVPLDKVVVFPGTGDFDGDGDVDLADFAEFTPCMTGPPGPMTDPDCSVFDFEPDNDVDLEDYAAFQSVFAAP